MSNYDIAIAYIDSGKYVPKTKIIDEAERPIMPFNPTAKQAREFVTALEAYEQNHKDRALIRSSLNAEIYDIEQVVFRYDLAKIYELVGHEKENIIWSKAWYRGHDEGLEVVACWYEEFAEVAL